MPGVVYVFPQEASVPGWSQAIPVPSLHLSKIAFIYYVCRGLQIGMLTSWLAYRRQTSEANMQESVLCLQYVGPGGGTQVISLGSKYLYLLSHFSTPHPPTLHPAPRNLSSV